MKDTFARSLVLAAMSAREMAHAPYSHYTVGAALLTESGEIYRGCNIENASYGATVCAERTAFFKAVSDGEWRFCGIAIVGGKEGETPTEFVYPCGICRQVMREFVGDDFPVIVANGEGDFKEYRLGDLLPHAFGGDSIR